MKNPCFSSSPSPKRAKSPAAVELDVTTKTEEDEVFVKDEKETEQEQEIVDTAETSKSERDELDESSELVNTSTESPVVKQQSDSISVHQCGEQIESWMCKTCNCIFLDEVSILMRYTVS